MKKIFLFITTLITFTANAQEFESVDDALEFLGDTFKGSTYVKTGNSWSDPVELMFDINEINIFQYRGTILEKDFTQYNKQEAAKLVADNTVEGILYFNWPEIISAELVNKNGEYWITIEGPVYNDKSKLVAERRTLYIADKGNAEKIKEAIEYCIIELAEE
jgi:hypothetical protein